MRPNPKAVALAVGFVAALTAATLGQTPGRSAGAGSAAETLQIDGNIDWILKSDVSARREGVIKAIELDNGMPVKKGDTIGLLYPESAELAVKKAQIAASSAAAEAKAEAQKDLAIAVRARLKRLNEKNPFYASKEEVEKAEAEVKVAAALVLEAQENKKLAGAELAIAQQVLEEHIIRSPFDGVIFNRMKNPGEAVRANEAVVSVGKRDKLRFFGYIPIEHLGRVKPGMTIDVRPVIDRVDIPVEQKRFRGKITGIGAQVQTIVREEAEVFAEVANNTDFELRPGMKATMIIYLGSLEDPGSVPPPPPDMLKDEGQAPAPSAVLGTRATSPIRRP